MEPSHLERHQSPSRTALTVAMLDQRGQLLRAALGFAGLSRPPYDRALWALRTSTPGLVSEGLRSAWRAKATTSNSPATTSAAGEQPSTRPGWSTRPRARRAPGGSARRGTRRRGRRGRLSLVQVKRLFSDPAAAAAVASSSPDDAARRTGFDGPTSRR